MDNRYQSEIDEFDQNFHMIQDKRIVLYGIGRYTATLVEGLQGYQIVGLMDKDPENVGKVLFGLPILSLEEAQKVADLIIINTAETYWNVIYQRIRNSMIPIYFRNGNIAQESGWKASNFSYWISSSMEIEEKMRKATIISFDYFDTLFSRTIYTPDDVFRVLDIISFRKYVVKEKVSVLRKKALQNLDSNYTLDELYNEIWEISDIPYQIIKEIERCEIELEKLLLKPRLRILNYLKEAICDNKEVFIVSDMYLPKNFYIENLFNHGILINEDHILISCEQKRSKGSGELWKYYLKEYVGDSSCLHIGDDWKADIEFPKKFGICSCYVASNRVLIENSSLKTIIGEIVTESDSLVIGLLLNRLFNDPFALNKTFGQVVINNNQDMGYCVFGPVIMAFFQWLFVEIKRDNVTNLFFMARDGYFLKEDFDYFCLLSEAKVKCDYIGISRQLAMTASVNSEKDLQELIGMPYSGPVQEMLRERFQIETNDTQEIKVEDYLQQIENYVSRVSKAYRKYLKQFDINNESATIDIGYYGNNQKYLNKLCETNMLGYYFNANISSKNRNSIIQRMKPCFQEENDDTGRKSEILRRQIYLESFLTAPYGMIKAVDESMNFIYNEKKSNQLFFDDKIEINKGVKEFIQDYLNLTKNIQLNIRTKFVDLLYGKFLENEKSFSDSVKRSFYNDNGFVNSFDTEIFT